MVLNPEKRKVGGSTPPLTTSSDQHKRPSGSTRAGRLTATSSTMCSQAITFGSSRRRSNRQGRIPLRSGS